MRVKLLILISFFFLTNLVFGQMDITFFIKTTNYTTGKKEAGVAVKLLEGANTVSTQTTDASGEVKLMLKAGKKYKVEVSKAGKVSRLLNINVANVNDELLQGTSKPSGQAQISLFDEIANVDYSYVKTNPITEFYFDGQNTELQYDNVLADKMAKKIEKIMKDAEASQKQGDANYNSIIKQADALFTAKKYEEALTQYETATKIKGKEMEKYPNDRIIEIDGILKASKSANLANSQLDSEYKALITSADGLRDQKKYPEAIARYQEALTKKQEQYPKDEIQKCELAIETAKKDAETAAKYDAAMKQGDQFYTQKSWMAARDEYKKALKIRPGDAAATAKLTDLDGKLNAQKSEQEKKQKYNDAVAAGDALLAEEKWADAKAKYTEALTFESAATYPKEKIKEVDAKLAEIAKANALKEQITKLLAEGNTALTAKQYPGAKAKFEQVLTLDKENGEAKAKIDEINKQLEFEKANAEKIAKAKQLIAEGDALDKATKYADAKLKYQESIGLIPDAAVQAKIDAIDSKLKAEANKAEQKAKFDQAILDGDAALTASNFEVAKKKYEEAQLLDATSAIPKQKLIELGKKEAQANAEKDKNQKYQEAFNAGTTALGGKDYVTAKEKFLLAVATDNTKKEAKDKLAEVEKIIADNAQATAQKEKYDAAVKAGSDLLGLNKLPEAKKKFEEASILDPSQALPKEKIKEIDGLIAKADKEKQITQLLAEGSAALGKKDLGGAKGKYQQVLALEPTNTVASEKMLEISKLENDQASEAQKQATFEKLKGEGMAFQNQNKYAEAKQKYLEAKAIKSDDDIEKAIVWCDKKIAEELKDAELNKKYNLVLEEAKGLETAKKYDEAIAKYNEAITIKNEQEPKNRIAAIKALKEASAEQLKVEQDYQAALKKGDDLLAAKKYTDAIQSYNAALVLKPYEKLPVEKAENAKKLSEQETSDGDNAYQKIIDVGNKAFDEKNYVKAKEMFNRAVNFRPADQYPKQKLAKIEALEKEEKLALDLQNQFTKKMAEADGLAKANKLEEAITAYKAAKTIKPDDLVPDQKIAELQSLLANKVDPALEEKKLYDEAMSRGNNAASSKDYNGAITYFEEALRHKAKDQTAANKIAEMRQILDDIAKENAANKELQGLVAAADQEFNDGKWSAAKNAYDKILVKYPSNAYVYEQSKKCEIKLNEERDADIARAYGNIISGADDKFDNKNYDKAKELYERASKLKPADPYPKQRLKEIQNILSAPVANNVVTSPETNKLELKNLGEPTDNSLVDGAKRLEQASITRKGKASRKMVEKLRGTTDKTGELSAKQNNTALSADSLLSEIRVDNTIRDVVAVAKVQNNVDIIDVKTETLLKSTEENKIIKELNIVNQKEQLDAATQAAIVSNNALDGAAIDNNEILKKATVNLENTGIEMSNETYAEIVKNDVAYSKIRSGLEKSAIDDLDERLAEEKKVRDASMVQTDLETKNRERSDAKAVETKEVLTKVENNIAIKSTDDKVLSVNNDDKIKEIEKVQSAYRLENDKEHVENTQRFAAKTSEMEKVTTEAISSRVDAHRENIDIIETARDKETELQRADYNKAYIKNIENKQVLTLKEKEVEKRNDLPSISQAENNKNFTQIQDASTQKQLDQKNINDDKIVANKSRITTSQNQIDDKAGQNTQSTDNATIISNSNKELGTTARIQSEKGDERALSTKKSIDDIESKQPVKVSTGAYEVDLSKYPEGVNQEQFDQLGSDGLVSAIVTRRVVVKDGRANVYIRTQTMEIVTYQKNGQPCTELVWQRETQDAKLKRNY
jgi:epidermal growth factor receptor substrate 15